MSNQQDALQESPVDISGCVGIYTNAFGRVIASVSDFDRTGYGGFSLYQSQKYRAERALAAAVVKGYCSPEIATVLDAYDCQQIVGKLKGTMTFMHVAAERSEHGR